MEQSLNSDKVVQVGDRVDPSNIKKREEEYGNHSKNFSSNTCEERETTIRKELDRLKADYESMTKEDEKSEKVQWVLESKVDQLETRRNRLISMLEIALLTEEEYEELKREQQLVKQQKL
ncbi:hypothetical protein HHI36_015525 [Cryptolaemus montrouzieri]|uniref:Uncharacterized protein n=1 Tax=Cryptolaemus montrouzieri TaxID=559131 RepID=A0ABD2N5V5_9CUCU